MGKKAIVIGAGLGGLSAAARLAHSGWKVILLEQDKGPGGKAGSMEIAGFRFDTGPSLVTMPFVMEQTFSDLGEDPGKYLSFRPLEELCSYFYQDGTR
ncbi:MAG: FAD-dependent oxidoreductase, partial [Candidatus Thermoplasmatota archaeon]|nr:FAD-dependent oxidoreductase [Candidatus Thermoplasmatota archaeon]